MQFWQIWQNDLFTEKLDSIFKLLADFNNSLVRNRMKPLNFTLHLKSNHN